MTATLTYSALSGFSAETPAVDGPVVLAAKPFDATESPLAIARWLAQREDRELHVVSVYEDELDALAIAAGAPALPHNYYEEERVAVAARMREELQRTSPDVTCQVDVVSGPSARLIVDMARERNARVIVIGTGRHDPMGRFLYGERAMQIVRLADRPVLIVPRDATAGTIMRAVVAVDFSRASLRAARAVIPMLSFGAELTLLHVRPERASAGANARSSAVNARCDEMFARFIGLLAVPPGIKVSTRITWGETVEAVDLYARSVAADIVVCGRVQTHTIAERVLVGSISAGLLRRVHCPILIAPELRDDARDDARSPLTGEASWQRPDWIGNLVAFSRRNEGRRVRLATELSAADGARCVVQNYHLRSISVDENARLRILLTDRNVDRHQLMLEHEDLGALTLNTNVAGEDTNLEFTYREGRGTLTVDPRELP